MKTFVTTGLGSQQSLENIQDEKIPVYDTLSDAQSDLANLEEGQIIATRDYGTPTPVISVVDTVADGNMNAVTSNAVYDSLQNYTTTSALETERSYSTTEVDTGKKWIDGKSIYRKVIEFGALPNSNLKTVAHNITDYEYVTKLYGTAVDSTDKTVFPLPRTTGDNNFINLFMTSTNICINDATDRSNFIGYVTVEYTKTV